MALLQKQKQQDEQDDLVQAAEQMNRDPAVRSARRALYLKQQENMRKNEIGFKNDGTMNDLKKLDLEKGKDEGNNSIEKLRNAALPKQEAGSSTKVPTSAAQSSKFPCDKNLRFEVSSILQSKDPTTGRAASSATSVRDLFLCLCEVMEGLSKHPGTIFFNCTIFF